MRSLENYLNAPMSRLAEVFLWPRYEILDEILSWEGASNSGTYYVYQLG